MEVQEVSRSAQTRKTQPEEFDLVILGGGTGGTLAAWTFAGECQRVAVIERKYVGGSCPNIACLPSKNVIHSAKVASYFRRSEEFGVKKRDFKIDMRAVQIAMTEGLPYTALRDAILTHPTLVEGLYRFFLLCLLSPTF